jgi:hypothetical protein
MALKCDICCDKFTSKLRHPIQCDYANCKAITCLKCFKQYLIMENSEQECMSCKQPISTEFIFMHTPKVFRDEYVKKVVEGDIVKERSLLIATRERLDALHRNKILRSRISALSAHLKRYPDDEEMFALMEENKKEVDMIKNDILKKSDDEINSTSTVFLCPMSTCAYGLVKKGRCGDCKKMICVKCREERLNDHECKQEHLDTIKMIKRDTKPCPKCSVAIYKIDGCDQMFCTKCKTAFSWRTLTIQRGLIHNPHYHEYMAQVNTGVMNIAIRDNDPCGNELAKTLREMPKKEEYIAATKHKPETRAINSNNFLERVLNEINAILPVLAHNVHDDETLRQIKQKLRENYITQKKNNVERAEVNWNNQLRLAYKQREMKKDLIKIIEVFDRGIKDFLIMGHANNDYITMFDNIINFIEYFITQLKENEKRHNLTNKTTISIEHGIQCRLIRY